MITITEFGENGITQYIYALMEKIKENPNQFLAVGRIADGDDNYSFVALFEDKCTIGNYSALLHEWGTNNAKSGEGGRGFINMNEFLEENNIKVLDMELNPKDAEKIGYTTNTRFERLSDWDDRVKIWKYYVNKLKNFTL